MRGPDDFDRVSLPRVDADALRDVLISEQSRTVIEVGLAYGSSALAIAEALLQTPTGDPRHVIIDPYQSAAFAGIGWNQLQAAGVDGMCALIEEPSQYALPRLLTAGFTVDAAFVDGSHLFHNVFVDLYFLDHAVRPNGVVVLDDCAWSSVATAVGYYERYLGWTSLPIEMPTRLRAFRRPSSRPACDFTTFTAPGTNGW